MIALLSTTMRFSGVIGEETGQLGLGQAARRCPTRHAVTKTLEFIHVKAAQAVELLWREEHRRVALLATNDNGLALGRIQKAGKTLLGISGRNVNHMNGLS